MTLTRYRPTPWWWSVKIETCRSTSWLHRASNNVEHFLLPTDAHKLKNVELLKHSKINKIKTLQHRRATGQWQQPTFWAGVHTTWPYATCLTQYTLTQCTTHTPYRVSPILYLFYPVLFLSFWIIICIFHTYPLLKSQHAAIALTKPCTSFTHLLLTKRVTFSQVLTLAPWRWFPFRPKHVGAFLFYLF